MGQTRVFKMSAMGAEEMPVPLQLDEEQLRTLVESNAQKLLGLRLLKSDIRVGRANNEKIDAVGIDEYGSRSAVQYMRNFNETQIARLIENLEWMEINKGSSRDGSTEELGSQIGDINWPDLRIICVTGSVGSAPLHAPRDRRIDVVEIRRHNQDILVLNTFVGHRQLEKSPPLGGDPYLAHRLKYRIERSSEHLRNLFLNVSNFLSSLGTDVRVVEYKMYSAFKKKGNFACAAVFPKSDSIRIFLTLDPDSISLEAGFTRSVRGVGHFGTGNLEVIIRTREEFAKAQPLMQRAYDEA